MRNLEPALNLIKKFEGLYLNAYLCPAGIPTIGYGTIMYPDGRHVQLGEYCMIDEAEAYLIHEMKQKATAVENLVKRNISNNSFCALVSFAYNLGVGALDRSTLLAKLNGGYDLTEVAQEFDKWVRADGKVLKGLVRRREEERRLFLRPDPIDLSVVS